MKKGISMILTLVLILSLGMAGTMQAEAADDLVCVDGSYLLDDADESVGNMEISTWGYYLKSGSATLSEIGTGKIGVGGDTTAQRVVDTISVTVKVQRLVDGYWEN